MPKVFHLIINPKALEFYKDILEYVTGLKSFQYCRVVEHIGQSEKHYHMFLQLNTCLNRLSTKKLHGAHIQPRIEGLGGSNKKLLKYINCEDNHPNHVGVTAVLIDEIGEYKEQGGNNRWTIQNIRECDDDSEIPAQLYNIRKKIKLEDNNKLSINDFRKKVKVYYIQGPSGIGKTEKALQLINDLQHMYGEFFNEVKYINSFWTGCTDGCKIALYDDWRDSHMFPSEFINFIDYNKHNMNIKGGYIKNNYELIIITSILHIDDIYSEFNQKNNFEPSKQWKRRVEVIDMFPKNEILFKPLNINKASTSYEKDDECYYCNKNIICECQCIINNKKCKENSCNIDKYEITDNNGDHIIIN